MAQEAAALIQAVLLGLAAGGLACMVRVAPWWPAPWRLKKPLSCPTCMGTWCTLALASPPVATVLWPSPPDLLQVLAAVGIAAWLNGQVVPPELPPLLGEDNPPSGM